MQGLRINHNAAKPPEGVQSALDRMKGIAKEFPFPSAPAAPVEEQGEEYKALVEEITRLSMSAYDRRGLELATLETKNASVVFGVFKGLLAAIDAFSFSESSLRITKSDVLKGQAYNIQFKIEGEEIMVDLISKGVK